jgi:hypothetical protein
VLSVDSHSDDCGLFVSDPPCANMPEFSFTAAGAPTDALRFGAPADPNTQMILH